jgi:hypothetical protein
MMHPSDEPSVEIPPKACGLYCFNRSSGRFVKLA